MECVRVTRETWSCCCEPPALEAAAEAAPDPELLRRELRLLRPCSFTDDASFTSSFTAFSNTPPRHCANERRLAFNDADAEARASMRSLIARGLCAAPSPLAGGFQGKVMTHSPVEKAPVTDMMTSLER